MPIRVANDIPAKNQLTEEGIIFMEETRANTQDIRPLDILILNLMPKKEETETQLLRLIGNSPLQINVEFLMVKNHESKNTNLSHIEKFYQFFDDIRNNYYDALIVTGAPIEHMDFEEVDYWKELQTIFEWSKTHVFSCLHICWAAQARLYNDYKIAKTIQPAKVFGVFEHRIAESYNPLIRGFSDVFLAPHSRQGLEIKIPINYFPNDDDTKTPLQTWKTTAHLFYHNWLNAVYQLTPYDLKELDK